jgi:hypothetical protein
VPKLFPGEGLILRILRSVSFSAKQLRTLDASGGLISRFIVTIVWTWNQTATPVADVLIGLFSRSPHIAWLNCQYRDVKRPQQSEFNPAAYDLLARLLREDGYDLEARKIASAKLRMERLTCAVFPANILSWFYEKLFDYGLSGGRALFTCLVCILAGFAATQVAIRQHVLVLNVSTVNTVAYHTQQDAARIAAHKLADGAAETEVGMPHEVNSATVQPGLIVVPVDNQGDGLGDSPHVAEIPCENRIDQYLFPVETFIPDARLQPDQGLRDFPRAGRRALADRSGFVRRFRLDFHTYYGASHQRIPSSPRRGQQRGLAQGMTEAPSS